MERYLEKKGEGPKRTNIVVIPGFSGKTLVDQTCNHFVEWLGRVFGKFTTPTTIWIFQHPLNIELLASWDEYPYAGESLLHQLKEKCIDENFSEDDSLILIGHKLGGFILKKALIDADRKAHHPHERDILESLDCLLMLGDPHLHRDNRSDWINLISGCLPSTKPLPQRLSVDQSVQCLQAISSKFEDFRLNSRLFQISGTGKVKRKGALRFRRHEKKDGCIRSATVAVRMWSTQEPEKQVPQGIGHAEVCAFTCGSTHYENLLNAFDENFEHRFLPLTGPTSYITPTASSNADTPDVANDLDILSSDESDVSNLTFDALSVADAGVTSFDLMNVGNVPQPGSLLDDEEGCPEAPTGPAIDDITMNGLPPSSVGTLEAIPLRLQECSDTLPTIPTSGSEQGLESSMDQVTWQDEAPALAQGLDGHASLDNRSLVTVHEVSAPVLPFNVKLPLRYNIPEHLNRPFFGRRETLSHLDRFFSVEDDRVASDSSAPPRRFILSGVGGCGKTQIALQYVNQQSQRFDVILWFRSHTAVYLAQNYHAAAQDLGLVWCQVKHDHVESRQKLKWWLETAGRPFLLIFDDVENYPMLEKYIPHSAHGQIIITSRRPYSGSHDRGASLLLAEEEIGPLSTEEAVSFLKTLVPQAIEEADPAAPRVIAEQLGNLPLALGHCATYIARRQWTFREFATILAEQRAFNELSAQPSIHQINLRFPRRTDFAGYCSTFHWSDFSEPAASMMSVLCFLDPGQVSESILLVLDNDLPSQKYPCSDKAYCSARSELLMHDVCARSRSKRSLYTHSTMTDNMRASMDPTLFEVGFKTASRLLMKVWPSRRKLPNILQANWPEFDALHNHVWKLSNIYKDCPSGTPDNGDISTNVKFWYRSPAAQESLVSDDFVRLLVYSTWYNAHRGNIDEDSSLLSIACDILQESSLRSADGRTLGTPDTTCWIVIDAVDDLFGAVVQEHKITFHKRPDRVVYVPSVDRRPPMQANNSPHVLPTHHQQLRDTDMENCASLLQHGCRLACENRPIEALAKLQQAKDLVSAFKQPTSASVALFISASLYLGHLYLTQGLVDAASAAFHAVSQWAKEFEGLFVDSLLLGRLEFGLATVETGASEVKTQHYQRALKLFESNRCPEVPETNDWWAITQLKLSDAYLHAQPHDIPAAAAALQHALDHFQAQKTSHAHFHTARALYKRALIFDAEGNSMMKMAFQAAAKELWIHTVGTDDTVGQSLTLDDFDDKILEPWFK